MSAQRNTVQKSLIKEALNALSHPSAEDIYRYVHKRHPAIGKATLYRNLKTMSEEGKILKIIPTDGGAGRYDPCTEPHFHGECRICGQLCDITMDPSQPMDLKARVMDTNGFLIENEEVIFKGICPYCIKIKNENGGKNEGT